DRFLHVLARMSDRHRAHNTTVLFSELRICTSQRGSKKIRELTMHFASTGMLTVPFVSMTVAFSMAAFAQTPDPAKWSELQAKAKQEGQVVVAGPAFQGLRAALSEAF